MELFLTLFGSFCYFPDQMTQLIWWGVRFSFESVWKYKDDDNNLNNLGALGGFVSVFKAVSVRPSATLDRPSWQISFLNSFRNNEWFYSSMKTEQHQHSSNYEWLLRLITLECVKGEGEKKWQNGKNKEKSSAVTTNVLTNPRASWLTLSRWNCVW